MTEYMGVLIINDIDYTEYVKGKSGFGISRDNTNAENAGRDQTETMHTMVTSHQRKLTLKLGPMPYEKVLQLENDLEDHDDGILVTYPDLKDGICTRLFYNTSIEAAYEYFTEEGIMVDNINLTLISVKEEVVV